MNADELAEVLGASKPFAYKLIRSYNDELKTKGYLTIAGRVPRTYIDEKIYGFSEWSGGEKDAGISRQED
jgi:hypothetical protein